MKYSAFKITLVASLAVSSSHCWTEDYKRYRNKPDLKTAGILKTPNSPLKPGNKTWELLFLPPSHAKITMFQDRCWFLQPLSLYLQSVQQQRQQT